MNSITLAQIDAQREKNNYLSIAATMQLAELGNTIFDPFSTLISTFAVVGVDNIFYPNTIVACDEQGSLTIGDDNTFFSGSALTCVGGSISVKNNNQFGEGGFIARADHSDAIITIGSNGRYTSGVQLFGTNSLGTGSQIHGVITVINCTLSAGESFIHPDPDLRAGVLKGYGPAKNLVIDSGEVIAGNGIFQQSDLKRQTFYHPKK